MTTTTMAADPTCVPQPEPAGAGFLINGQTADEAYRDEKAGVYDD